MRKNVVDRIHSDQISSARIPPSGPGLPAEPSMRTIRTDVGEMDALLEGIGETHSRLRRLRRSLGSLERPPGSFLVAAPTRQQAPAILLAASHLENPG